MRLLLLVNAVAMFAAGVVLFISPGLIPGAVGIDIEPSAYFLAYLLGAAELALACLCYLSRDLADPKALRAVALTCIVFHAMSAVAEIAACTHGLSAGILANVAVRAIMVILLAYFGLYRVPIAR